MKKMFCVVVVFLFLVSSFLPVYAATGPDYWLGNTSANLGDTPDNWTDQSTNDPPVTGDSWVFDAAGLSGATLNNNLSAYSVGGITFNPDASPYTINGNSITLTGNIDNNSANNETLDMGISGTITNAGTGTGGTVITGAVSGVTTVTQDSSTSALTLGGGLSVNSGGTTLTDSSGSLIVSGGVSGSGNLVLNNNGSVADGITLSNNSVNNTGAIINSGTGSGSTFISADIGSNVTGVTQDSATSTLVLGGDNSYAGATNIDGGVVQISASDNLGDGSSTNIINMNGGTLESTSGTYSLAANQGITLAGAGGTIQADSGQLTVSGAVSGTGNLILNNDSSTDGGITLSNSINNTGTITNSGTGSGSTIISANIGSGVTGVIENSATSSLTLSGDNSAFGGTTTLTAGTLNAGSNNALGSSTIVFDGGTLQYSAASAATDYSGQFSNIANQAYNIDTNSQDVTFASSLSSSGGSLTKIGSGTLTLSAADSYTGATTINAGTLQLGHAGAIPSGSDVSIASGATLDLNDNSATIGSLAGAGTVTSNTAGSVTLTTGDTNPTTFSGTIENGSGTVGLTIQGSAIFILSGNNSYTGGTTLTSGTLNLGSSDAIGSGIITFGGGTLQYSVASAGTDISSQFSNAADQAYNIDTNGQDVTLAANLTSSGGTLDKIGSGILTLIGDNTYSGGTTLTAGTLNLGSNNAIGAGTITFDGGILQYSAASAGIDYSGQFSNAADQAYNIDTNGQSPVTFAADLTSSGGSLTKIGSGMLTLSGNNTYTGTTTINGGTLQLGSSDAIPSTSDVSIASGATLDLNDNSATIGSLAGEGTVTSNAAGSVTLTTGDSNSTMFSGTIQNGSGTVGLNIEGSGTFTLSGSNSYSGGTNIGSGSTLQVENADALGTGSVTNSGILSIGANTVSLGSGSYTQTVGSTLDITVNNTGSLVYGSIASTVAASVAAGSSVVVNVQGIVPTGSELEIVNSNGTSVGTGPQDQNITSTSSLVTFSRLIVDNNLYLVAYNSGFASVGSNPNAQAVGRALDSINVTKAPSDMLNVLNTLQSSTNAQISSALNTLGPVVDGGVIQNSAASFDNLVSATLDRIQNALDRSQSAVSFAADDGTPNGLWAEPYGSYLSQNTVQSVPGYSAWNGGTVVGYDHMITDDFTLGASGGYSYGEVNSDANNASTNIKSAQGTIYAGYEDPVLNYFIDATGSFAWNWYDGQRDITVGSIDKTADATYNGQQYGTFLEAGYKIYFADNPVYPDLQLTPLASLQWTHLDLDSYTETNAGSLDLNVGNQGYDVLESGLGVSLSNPTEFEWGNFTPEIHAKWLHDYTSEDMDVTASFTGGGNSFTSYGAKQPRDGADVGGKLYFDLTNNLSLIAQADAELKEGFFGAYGSGTVRYKF